MRTIVFISILVLGLCGCKQQAKEITEQDFATFAVRCIRALETKYKGGDSFNLVENFELLCKESGMKKMSDKELLKGGFDVKDIPEGAECSAYRYMGKDSLLVAATIYYTQLKGGYTLLKGRISVEVLLCVANPLRYGNVIPNKYKNAFWKELAEQGLYSVAYDRKLFPQGVTMDENDYPNYYVVNLHLNKY